MPKRDPNQPPPGARRLGEALRCYAGPDLVRRLDAAGAAYAAAAEIHPLPLIVADELASTAEQRTTAAHAALVATVQRLIEHGLGQLRAGAWSAWGREGSPAAPLRRLPAEAWAVLRVPGDWWVAIGRGENILAGSVVEVQGSPLRFFGVIVSAAAVQRRTPLAAVRLALLTAETEKGKSLTLREADAIAHKKHFSRAQARRALEELRRGGR
jgi:hypothetical protein